MNLLKSSCKYWTQVKDINQQCVLAEYAVRGLVPQTAAVIQEKMNKGEKFPFQQITELNIGNPQIFGQKPISFNRQVASAILDEDGLSRHHVDVQRRVRFYLNSIGYGVGAYSQTLGYPVVRQAISNFIQKRDNTSDKPDINSLMLTDGASQGITIMFQTLLKDPTDGVMIPIPQYPLYSAVITQCNAHQIPYFLEEESGWTITKAQLESNYQKALSQGIKPRILVVINPGNPTGQVLDRTSLEDIKKLIIFADEVYQENVYAENKKFTSIRKVYKDLNLENEIYSFHSISKGITGECGLRGGYMEITAPINAQVQQEILKNKSITLSANTIGQIMTGLMVQPPTIEEGCTQQTVDTHREECKNLFESLKKRAQIVTDYLNQTKGVKCQPIEGALYAFPKIELSDKFINHAKSLGRVPDSHYSLELLNNTGLVVVPGSGFHQKEGTHHFRMTILIQPNQRLLESMKTFKRWHENFMQQF
ncbi:hypothetical protein pb186bvf_007492 [Paramecium bursaria]